VDISHGLLKSFFELIYWVMGTAFFSADAVDTQPNTDTAHSRNDIPEKSKKSNKQCADTNGNAVWLFDKINQVKALSHGNNGKSSS